VAVASFASIRDWTAMETGSATVPVAPVGVSPTGNRRSKESLNPNAEIELPQRNTKNAKRGGARTVPVAPVGVPPMLSCAPCISWWTFAFLAISRGQLRFLVNMVTVSSVIMCSARRRTQRPRRVALPFLGLRRSINTNPLKPASASDFVSDPVGDFAPLNQGVECGKFSPHTHERI